MGEKAVYVDWSKAHRQCSRERLMRLSRYHRAEELRRPLRSVARTLADGTKVHHPMVSFPHPAPHPITLNGRASTARLIRDLAFTADRMKRQKRDPLRDIPTSKALQDRQTGKALMAMGREDLLGYADHEPGDEAWPYPDKGAPTMNPAEADKADAHILGAHDDSA